MWNTLLGTWITFGLHLDQSKYLGWGWNHAEHNSILLLSNLYNLIIKKLRYVITHHYKLSPSYAEFAAVQIFFFDYTQLHPARTSISHANSSKILHSKTLLTVIVFKIIDWWLGILYSFLDDASNFIVYGLW